MHEHVTWCICWSLKRRPSIIQKIHALVVLFSYSFPLHFINKRDIIKGNLKVFKIIKTRGHCEVEALHRHCKIFIIQTHWSFPSLILLSSRAPDCTAWSQPGKRWCTAASLSCSVSINSGLSVLATGPHSQQCSFIGSSIINEKSKASDDCDYLCRLDGSLQTSPTKHHVYCKYDCSGTGKWVSNDPDGCLLPITYCLCTSVAVNEVILF